jgi:hypothetical protein
MAMQITAAQSVNTFNGILLTVKALTGIAASQAGAGTGTMIGSGVKAASVTTTQTGSVVYGAMVNWTNSTAFTANGNSTMIDNVSDGTNGAAYGTCKSASATGSPGATTFGSSAPSTTDGCAAFLEILPSGTIAEDSSSPPGASTLSATTVTTNSFTPPGGSLLVAVVASDGLTNDGPTITVSGGSLTWTKQVESTGGSAGNSSVWTASVPGGGGTVAGALQHGGVTDGRNRFKQRTRARLAGGALLSDGVQGTTPFSGQTAAVTVLAVPGTLSGIITFVQQISGTSTFDYGFATVNLTTATTTGNGLVLVAGWDLSTNPTDAAMAAVYVSDSAGNYWVHSGTSTNTVSGSRSSVWVCVNAQSINWISVSSSTFVSSLAFSLIEIKNMPLYYQLDVVGINANSGASSLTVSPGSTNQGDISFAVFTTGATGLSPVVSSNVTWIPLTTVTAGSGSANPVEIFPYWQSTPGHSSVNTTWTISQSVPVSGVVVAISGLAGPPAQSNLNFPLIKVEAGFGFTPGDPSQSPPSWVDITSRAISGQGNDFISVSMGRQFELSSPEAGEINISIDNHDGAFTPGNTSSPYYPNVVLGTPVRVSAFWQTRWYFVGYGYVERWPQEWPDLPQWGISKLVATDAIAVLASCNMSAALDGDMLVDVPYVFLQASEQYTTFINGIDPTFTNADAQGLLAANTSRVNQRAAFFVDGSAGVAETGASTQILGDADAGFGASNITNVPTNPVSGPGVIYTDMSLPDPLSTNGVSVEFWVIIPSAVTSTQLQPVVFSAFGPPSNYRNAHPSFSVLINNFTGGNTLTVTLNNGTTVTAPFLPSVNAQQIVFLITSSSLAIYINGGLQKTVSITSAQISSWSAVTLGCPNYAYGSGSLTAGNFTAFDFAIYDYQLPFQRIVSHFATGNSGQEGIDATQRVAQIMAWGNLSIGRGGQVNFSGTLDGVAQGPAYSLEGQTAADGINQVVLNNQEMVTSEPSGNLHYIHRWALFNQMTSFVFGDSNNVSDGEIPYTQDVGFGYDNTYVYNIDQVTQQIGPNNGITVTVSDFTSQHEYFTRSALTSTITTLSNLDAYEIANWQIAKYAQPSMRVANINIDAASNPNAFPEVLDIQQGNAVTVNRRPIGGAVISNVYLVQKITHEIGTGVWKVGFQLSPYVPESNVMALDTTGFNVLGNETLA